MHAPALLALLAGALFAGCAPAARPSAAVPPLAGTEWTLTELEGRTPPPGDGGRPATLRFEAERVGGFAGCNTFFGGYTAAAPTLRLSELGATRKGCEVGMELEQRYLAALGTVRAFQVVDGAVELRGDGGVVARLVPAGRR